MRNVKIALEILGKANFEDVWSEISKNREKKILLEKENKKLTRKNEKCLDLICSYHNINETMFQEREIDRIEIELLKEEKKNLTIKVKQLEAQLKEKIEDADSEITICCRCSDEETCQCDCHIKAQFEQTKRELNLLKEENKKLKDDKYFIFRA